MKRSRISSIVVSAGYSSRMGDFKPFLKFGEYTAVETVINALKNAGIENIIIVSGFRGEEVINKLRPLDVKCVLNENYARGMFTSIVKGLEALPEDSDAFLMLPVDVPLVKGYTIKKIIDAYFESGKGIIYPTFMGEKGHPPLIDCKYKNSILKSSGEGGLKNILEGFSDDSICIKVSDEAAMMDMDTKKDYEELLKYYKLNAPNIKECYAVLDINNVPDNIVKHCERVSEVGLNIIRDLNNKGCHLDEEVFHAAALLHDIAKGVKNHDKAGAMLLKEMGYEKVGSIISTHTDLEVKEDEKITENEILYIADKIVKEDKVVSIEERFSRRLKEYEDNSEVIFKIKNRYDSAVKIRNKIEVITGKKFIYE